MSKSIIRKLDKWFKQIERRETVLIAERKTKLASLFQRWLDHKYKVRIISSKRQLIDEIDYSTDYLLVDRYFAEEINSLLDDIKLKYSNMPIILLTGVEPELDQLELEVDDYIVKPADQSKIMTKIESVEIKQRKRGLTKI